MNAGDIKITYCFFFLFILFGCVRPDLIRQERDVSTCLDHALEKGFLERKDISMRPGTDGAEGLMLPVVSQAMQTPLGVVPFSDGVYKRFSSNNVNLGDVLAFCAEIYGFEPDNRLVPQEGDAEFPVPELNELYGALVTAVALFDTAFDLLSEKQTEQVRIMLVRLLFQGPYRQGVLRHKAEAEIEQVFNLASRIDLEHIWSAAMVVARAVDNLVEKLKSEPFPLPENTVVHTPLGDVVIGSTEDEVYQGKMPLILISPGGNNVYQFADHAGFHVIIDVSGNDTYFATENSFPGSGISGIGFLVDMEGDDTYIGNNFSFGAGLLGVGVTADFSGNDSYTSGVFSQGAAAMGMGILLDTQGDDIYESVLYSQAMGYVGGVGLLFDLNGNDVFRSGGVVPDAREEQGAFQTYSQGFGLGQRSFAPGGAGILFSASGDNRFEGSYFCQGASYWKAFGLLISGRGNDRFHARRYAQGAGIHSSLGAIINYGGNNSYVSWGVSQGCGHDYGVGLLVDRQGDDTYEADWLSQGAGISGGLGMLIDCDGENGYSDRPTCRGYGAYDDRRNAASIGILVDAGATQNRLWRRGELGAGIAGCSAHPCLWYEPFKKGGDRKPDRQRNQTEFTKSQAPDAPLAELEAPLYLEDSWENAAARLASQGTGILPALAAYFSIKDVSVARAVEETIIKLAQTDGHGVKKFLMADDRTREEIVPMLFALGDERCSAAADVFAFFLDSDIPLVQAVALRGKYRHGRSLDRSTYEGFAQSANSAVRRYFARVLGNSAEDDAGAVETLIDLLSDADFQVRYAAYTALREKGRGAVPHLQKRLKQKGMPAYWYSMTKALIEK